PHFETTPWRCRGRGASGSEDHREQRTLTNIRHGLLGLECCRARTVANSSDTGNPAPGGRQAEPLVASAEDFGRQTRLDGDLDERYSELSRLLLRPGEGSRCPRWRHDAVGGGACGSA